MNVYFRDTEKYYRNVDYVENNNLKSCIMKRKINLLLMTALVLFVIACNDDDKSNGKVSSAEDIPQLSSLGFSNPVSSILWNDEIVTLSYANGKLADFNIKSTDGDYPLVGNMTTSPLSFSVYYEKDEITELLKDIKVNDKGCIVSSVYSSDDYDKYHYNYKYNSNSELIEVSGYISGGGQKGEAKAVYTWKDGNIISLEEYSTVNEEYEGEKYSYDVKISVTFEYGTIPNPGVYSPSQLYYLIGTEFFFIPFVGLMGKHTNNIPSRIIAFERYKEVLDGKEHINEGEYDYKVNVEYDKSGRIISIKDKSSDGDYDDEILFGYDGNDISLASSYKKAESSRPKLNFLESRRNHLLK